MGNIYQHITLGQFAQIRAISESDKAPEDKMVAMAALLQGISEDELLDMPLEKAQEVFRVMEGLDEPPKAARVKKKYQVGAWKLRVCDLQDLCVAQWVDFQQYGRLKAEDHLADTLSVALVPEGKKYNEGYDMAELKKALREKMSVADGLAVCFFFQRRYLKSMRRTLNSLLGAVSLKMRGEERKVLTQRIVEVQREISGMLRSL